MNKAFYKRIIHQIIHLWNVEFQVEFQVESVWPPPLDNTQQCIVKRRERLAEALDYIRIDRSAVQGPAFAMKSGKGQGIS